MLRNNLEHQHEYEDEDGDDSDLVPDQEADLGSDDENETIENGESARDGMVDGDLRPERRLLKC